ncbi:Immunoglobulin-like domain,Immunoglobulin-like fold [Cinara cedri]|uniref:Immunoglobulin-like domain,Immunoglobulin-like fold n=1 Tax=Cinara cedri TaxID=506608 RepID=A0A5E4M7Z0_9HEMI|nr:Immunoglobulin-like domain,Immunoglobulin-like fold [Cinara cedri]
MIRPETALFVFSLLAFQASSVNNVKLLNVRVPNHTVLGRNTKLECIYDLQGEPLYSVKWYKDGKEFFRYLPKNEPKIQVFEKPGIFIDLDKSNSNEVVLKSLVLSSSGIYRCEVSGEAPSFQTVFKDTSLNTVAERPSIDGLQLEYNVGEMVNANCTSSKMTFHTHLIWYINEEQINSTIVHGPYFKIHNTDDELLVTTVLGLSFKVNDSHYRSGHINLKCAAQLESIYLHSDEQIIKFTKHLPTESIMSNTVRLANKIQATSISIQNTPKIILLACVLLICLQNNIHFPISY